MHRLSLLADFLSGVLDAWLEDLLPLIRNLFDVVIYGDEPRFYEMEMGP